MKIGIAGPFSRESVAPFIDGDARDLPQGYAGAPMLGTLVAALLRRGHTVTAYSISTDVEPAAPVAAEGERFKITFCGVRRHALRYSNGRWGRATDAFRQERASLSEAIRQDAPDLVHAHWTYEFALAALESRLPTLVTCHDAPQVVLKYSPNIYRLVRYFMARRVLRLAPNLTAVSPYLQEKLATYAGVPIGVVPNPLPPRPAGERETKRHLYDPARPRIAMVLNGWGPLKNPKPALRAFAALRRKFPAAQLKIMGIDYGAGGPAEGWARSQGLADGVVFMGPQPYGDLLAHLAGSDLLLHPSLEETFGMAIAEAMAQGVPVIGGQSSGAVPWVIGEDGCRVDVRSPDAICDAAFGLLSNPGRLSELSIRAKRSAESRFSPDAVAASYEDYYAKTLSRGTQ